MNSVPIGDVAEIRRDVVYRLQLQQMAEAFGVSVDMLLVSSREPVVVRRRWLAMWIMRKVLKLSYPAIGRALHLDHSTAMYGVRMVERDEKLLAEATGIAEGMIATKAA